MKQTWLSMGMPVTVVIEDAGADEAAFQRIHDYFEQVDNQYSPYKPTSEVSRINDGLPRGQWSREMKTIMKLCNQTKAQTDGYFDPFYKGTFDPSGLVKGWAIDNAAKLLRQLGFQNFYVDVGGDIQASGHNGDNQPWSIGIRNPFDRSEIVKVVHLADRGIATSGTYIRGQHIYNPKDSDELTDVASLTVIGPTVYDADRLATAAFAMGRAGVRFIEALEGFEAYMITSDRQATFTGGFARYVGAA